MKRTPLYILFFIFAISLSSCNKDSEEVYGENILPAALSFNLPASISAENSKEGNKTLSGDNIYNFMSTFIHTGDLGATVVNKAIKAINENHLDKPTNLTFINQSDQREKHISVTENKIFEGKTYQYKLEMSDSGATCMQIFWNKSPIKGTTIIKPSVFNKNDTENPNAIVRIDYSEATTGYAQQMTVSVSGLTTNADKKINKIKLFAGKNNSIIDLYGNANWPTAILLDDKHQGGYQWAFVAKSDATTDISVISVGLPLPTYTSNTDILTEFSIKNVLSTEIQATKPEATEQEIEDFLKNTEAPGYFSSNGFISSGTNIPEGFSTDFIKLANLKPYTPEEINKLDVKFSTSSK